MKQRAGIFTISLDFELYWGLLDKVKLEEVRSHLSEVENVVERMLAMFERYSVHVTWATVGFMFARDIDELKKFIPENKPAYVNQNLNPYIYLAQKQDLEERFHFAPHLIERIKATSGQEIGSHTFCHYYCLERGQTKESFYSDIEAAVKLARLREVKLSSLVFPRNQFNKDYLSVLQENNVLCFRGNVKGWLYKAASTESGSYVRRIIRFIDSYVNLSDQNCYKLDDLSALQPFNIPASRFLRPVIPRLRVLEGVKMRRIKKSLLYAAKNKLLFHLWWHPHNFAANTDENIAHLEQILKYYTKLRDAYGMQSLNMEEVSDLLKNKS